MPVTSRVQTLRSSTALQRPASATRNAGELYVNFPDKQLGVIDAGQAPQDLIAVRFFSAATSYVAGDFVFQAGQLYRAKAAVPAAAFSASQWDAVFTAANDGIGTGLDADLLDGQEGTYYLALGNATGIISDSQHGNRGGGSLHSLATASTAGFLVDAASDGNQYVRKNAAWALVSVPPGTAVSDSPPASPQQGQMWWESDSGNLYIYYTDPTPNSQWVQVNGMSASALSTSSAGSDNQLARYDGVTGAVLQPSVVTINDAGDIAGANSLAVGNGGLTVGSGGIVTTGNAQLNTASVIGAASVGGALTANASITCNGNVQINWSSSAYINLVSGGNGHHMSHPTPGFGTINVSPSTLRHQFAFAGTNLYSFDQNFFFPNTNGGMTLGTASFRWGQIYSTSSTISTSDEKLKTDIRGMTDAEKRVAAALKGLVVTYRLKSAVAEKGDAARTHTGFIAQQVAAAFAAEGLDAHNYGLWCEDEEYTEEYVEDVPVEVEETDPETGEVTTVTKMAGRYVKHPTGEITLSLRYEELLCFVIGGL